MADGAATVTTDRADRVADALEQREADMLLVTDLINVRWLTGFTGSNAAAVVGGDGSRRFVTDFRYLTQSAEQVDPAWGREIAVDLLAGVAKGLPGSGELRLAFDDAHMSVKDHGRLAGMLRPGIELGPAGGAVETLRAVKDEDELEAIRAAARLADDALTEVLGRGLVGRTEREVALDLEFTMRRLGAQAASFPSIVAAGDHAALPHASPREVP
ncbi:MAG: M24 family metallopeptidase, partial [Solirubrobacteraceae bacterium]